MSSAPRPQALADPNEASANLVVQLRRGERADRVHARFHYEDMIVLIEPLSRAVRFMDAKAVIDRLRQALGARTDGDLAAMIGTPFQTLNSWKKRQSIPSAELIKICEARGLSLDHVVFGTDPVSRSALSWEEAAFFIGIRMAIKASGLSSADAGELERSIVSFTGWCRRLMAHEIEDLGADVGQTIAKFEGILARTPASKSQLVTGAVSIPMPADGSE